MRSTLARITLVLFVGLLFAPAAAAQSPDPEDPVSDLPVLGDVSGEQPDVPAQPDMPGRTTDDDRATTTRTPAQATGDGEILPVTGASAAVLAFSGAGLLAAGSLLLVARRLRMARGAPSEVLREVLWAAE